MSQSPRRILKITGIVILVLAGIIVIGASIAKKQAEKITIARLQQAGFTVKSVSVNILSRSVALNGLVYSDTVSAFHRVTLEKVKADGFHLIPFLRKKKIILDRLTAEQGFIAYDRSKNHADSVSRDSESKEKISALEIKFLSITAMRLAVLNNTVTESSAIVNKLAFGNFKLNLEDTTYTVGWLEADLKNLRQAKKGGLHTFALSRALYNSRNERLETDSFRVIPNYTKSEFARVAKIQKTCLDIVLPKIIFEGVKQERFFSDSTLEIKQIRIPGPVVHAYRDKRYPFVRNWIMPLPIEGIRRLPFKLVTDSILIYHAEIAYEEFSEKGLPVSGTITFNKLNASFAGLNTETKPGKHDFCTLVTDCKVMNSGSLHATFKLPLNRAVNYEAYGTLRNMDLKSLNPSLGNLTRIKISEGMLHDLWFNFSYNDDVSKGEILVNYKNLRLEALKKEKKNHETNKFLTAAINTIVKSDKDKSVDKSKRTGLIDIERDKKRFVFQFWWKSILDGLQSTFLNNGKKKKTQKESSR